MSQVLSSRARRGVRATPPRAALATIRAARRADLAPLGRHGAALARAHHEWDPARFFYLDDMEAGYSSWLGKELKNRRAVVLVAEQRGRVVGYAYGRIEPRDWNALRDTCGVAIDLFLEPRTRGGGLGRRLAVALLEGLAELGAPRVILQAASKNRDAQRFFRSLGFRPTFVEMTRELPAAAARVKGKTRSGARAKAGARTGPHTGAKKP